MPKPISKYNYLIYLRNKQFTLLCSFKGNAIDKPIFSGQLDDFGGNLSINPLIIHIVIRRGHIIDLRSLKISLRENYDFYVKNYTLHNDTICNYLDII